MEETLKKSRRPVPWSWSGVAVAALAIGASIAAVLIIIHSSDLAASGAAGLALALSGAALALLATAWRVHIQDDGPGHDVTQDAGRWALRAAFGGVPPADPDGRSMERRLDGWVERVRAAARAETSVNAEEITRDMELAREFQASLLNRPYPEVPAVHVEGRLRLEFHHRYEPTMAVGGDFFDVFPISNDCAGIFIADVMGHGIRSALITAILRTLISENRGRARNPALFMRDINTQFTSLLHCFPEPLFASAFYLVADTTSRMATYTCAGHPPPYLLHRDRSRISRLPNPKPCGAALGLIPKEEYTGGTVRLADGQTLLFFTDGLYECMNPQGHEFGLERVESILQANVVKPTPDILDAMFRGMNQFACGEPPDDDVCLVALDITTKAADPA